MADSRHRERYARCATRRWNDRSFWSLSPASLAVHYYIKTHPQMTSLGAMRGSPAGLADQLGWDPVPFKTAFGELVQKAFIRYDEESRTIWMPEFVEDNPPANPNVVKAWRHAWDVIPEGDLKPLILKKIAEIVEEKSGELMEAFKNAFESILQTLPKGLPKPFPTPYTEAVTEAEAVTVSEENQLQLAPSKPAQPPTAPPPAWPEELAWLKHFLETQQILALPHADIPAGYSLLAPDFWQRTNRICGGHLTIDQLERSFSKLANWIDVNPKKRPTPKGWRQRISTWLEGDVKREIRDAATNRNPGRTGAPAATERAAHQPGSNGQGTLTRVPTAQGVLKNAGPGNDEYADAFRSRLRPV